MRLDHAFSFDFPPFPRLYSHNFSFLCFIVLSIDSSVTGSAGLIAHAWRNPVVTEDISTVVRGGRECENSRLFVLEPVQLALHNAQMLSKECCILVIDWACPLRASMVIRVKEIAVLQI